MRNRKALVGLVVLVAFTTVMSVVATSFYFNGDRNNDQVKNERVASEGEVQNNNIPSTAPGEVSGEPENIVEYKGMYEEQGQSIPSTPPGEISGEPENIVEYKGMYGEQEEVSPLTPPDEVSDEPENIETYQGAPIEGPGM